MRYTSRVGSIFILTVAHPDYSDPDTWSRMVSRKRTRSACLSMDRVGERRILFQQK